MDSIQHKLQGATLCYNILVSNKFTRVYGSDHKNKFIRIIRVLHYAFILLTLQCLYIGHDM